jgi:hypothetical protein
MHGSLDLLLLAAHDIIADAPGRSFHRFGGLVVASKPASIFICSRP